jgi:hypothetical protein
MLYLRLLADKTHYPYAPEHLRAAYPQTSFPRSWSPVLLAEYGVYPVQATVPPSYDPLAATLEEGPPRRGESGWVQTWAVVALSPEEVAARRAAARAAMVCTPRQARLALQQAGLLGAVTAWIATAEETTRIEWEFASEIRRDWPAILACATVLGLTEEQLDGLFALAQPL